MKFLIRNRNNFHNRKIFLKATVVASVIAFILFVTTFNGTSEFKSEYHHFDDILDFEGFDNVNGVEQPIVPNIVHLLYLQETEMKFFQLVNILSVYLNHKPEYIYIHCDNCSFYGKYYDKLKTVGDLWKIVKIKQIPYKTTIFGVQYGWVNHHRSDIWRLLVLMNYGGIYLDNDVYVVNSLNKYRHFEITVSWDSDEDGLGVQVIIAHRNARLLKAHFDSYRYNYTPSNWYWNAGYMPAKILLEHRYMAHAVKEKLGTHYLAPNLYQNLWNDWKKLDTIHLLINHRVYLDKESPIREFDEHNIRTYNYTYGCMVRNVLKRSRIFK